MALTKKGALLITNDIDRVASVISAEYEALGLPEKVASGFAQWCDRISDRIERTAGIDPKDKAAKEAALKEALSGQQDHKTDYSFSDGSTFDAESISEEVSGRHEGDADETFMNGEFTQQERRELRELQEAGKVPGVNTDPRGPRPGVQASFANLVAVIKNGSFSGEAANKLAEALKLAADIAKSASDDADEDDEDEGKEASSHGYKLDA